MSHHPNLVTAEPRRPAVRRAATRVGAIAVVGALGLALTGCSNVIDTFNRVQGAIAGESTETPTPTPTASSGTTSSFDFISTFSTDGSVSLTTSVADGLDLILDVWAVDPKRTAEWTTDTAKVFGFAVNVHDTYVDEKAVLSQKRRVYISAISITSQTSETSGLVQIPFQFAADPRTLVPTDVITSTYGVLLNSYQGGLLVPETTLRQLPPTTYGITLQFALTVWVESTANTDTSFQQQTVYQTVPIRIVASTTTTETTTPEATTTG